MNLEEIWWEGVPKTHLAEDSGHWHAVMRMVLTIHHTSNSFYSLEVYFVLNWK